MPDNSIASAQPVAITQGIVFGEADGQSLMMDVARPEPLPEVLMPAVISIHGGGWVEGERGVGVDSVLPNHGFFYCSIDYRLAPRATFPAQIHDCKAAVRFLRANAEEFRIDPDRIGVTGGSAGGHLASLLGTSYDIAELEGESGTPGVSSRVQAVLPISGPSNFLDAAWWEGKNSKEVLRQLFGGGLEEKTDLARLASPLTHVRSGAPPFLIVHGELDETAPVRHARLLHEALRHAGRDTGLEVFEGLGHDLNLAWGEVRRLMLAFFRQHLG